ncbi:MAG TPA: carboxypeptidase-like regulatory domain-containing protein, partial [Lacibacter sp.]|nr:carboxypeptidase-like regulatory domain-containing protein [Lacibacter sp.]
MPNKKINLFLLKRKATNAVTLAIAVLLQLLFFTTSAQAQNITVKAKVTNEQGAAIEGASIVVKGTGTGTTTDNAGGFTISAQRNAVLVISAINFTEQEV